MNSNIVKILGVVFAVLAVVVPLAVIITELGAHGLGVLAGAAIICLIFVWLALSLLLG